jgi:hypothetical protein
MASSIQILRSNTAKERPFPGNLLDGQPALNTNSEEPGLFFKATDGSIVKIGPTAITSDGAPPNAGAIGQTGNTVGELWLDKSLPVPVLKVYDGTQWVDAGSGGGGSAVSLTRWVISASPGQTLLSGVDSLGQQLQYLPGLEIVYANGVFLRRGLDYTAANGQVITLVEPLKLGDEVTVLIYTPLVLGSIVNANVASSADIESNKLSFLQQGNNAQARTVQSKLRDSISVKDFGASGNGLIDDTDAIKRAIAASAQGAGGKVVFFPAGTYLVGSSRIDLLSGTAFIGEPGAELRFSENPVFEPIFAMAKTNVSVDGLTINANNANSAVLAIGFRSCTNVIVSNCRFINFTRFGLVINGGTNITITNNWIEKQIAELSQNQAILASTSAGPIVDMVIDGNTCIRSAIDISCSRSRVTNNFIAGWSFGAGITTEQDPLCSNNVIANNVISNGVGIDVNGYRVGGIENWGPNSVISGNICYENEGAGIDQGGQNCILVGNVFFNNKVHGISARYGTAVYNCNGSIFVSNRCFNTDGLTGPQLYGYAEQSALVSGVVVSNNNFSGNSLGPVRIFSSSTQYTAPQLQLSFIQNIPLVPSFGSTSLTLGFAGAFLGDIVQVSASKDLQGLVLSGYVDNQNSVTVTVFNPTNTSINLASTTLLVIVQKTKNSTN